MHNAEVTLKFSKFLSGEMALCLVHAEFCDTKRMQSSEVVLGLYHRRERFQVIQDDPHLRRAHHGLIGTRH